MSKMIKIEPEVYNSPEWQQMAREVALEVGTAIPKLHELTSEQLCFLTEGAILTHSMATEADAATQVANSPIDQQIEIIERAVLLDTAQMKINDDEFRLGARKFKPQLTSTIFD